MKKVLSTFIVLVAVNLNAQLVISFEFDDTAEINNNSALGSSFKTAVDGSAVEVVFNLGSILTGLTLTVTPSQDDISHTAVGLGIDSGGTFSAVGDSLNFSFNEDITLDLLDFGIFTDSESDSVTLNYSNLNPDITLVEGDLDTSKRISFTSGNSLSANESFSIDWVSGNGLALEGFDITVVPEPSTYALIVGGLALGVVLLKRRRNARQANTD